MQRTNTIWCIALAAALALLVAPASAQDYREVNISGATLFADFFKQPASTNDFINVDGDEITGDHDCDPDTPDQTVPFAGFWPCIPPYVDQLAPSIVGCVIPTDWWVVQYRGVGSGNGLKEMVNFQLAGEIPQNPPADVGRINRLKFAEDGLALNPCPPANPSGTPLEPTSIDLAVMDVPTRWFVKTGDPDLANWRLLPGESGYGYNPLASWDDPTQGQNLKSLCLPDGVTCLNIDTANPDGDTVYDTRIAWVPISIIANRGTGLENVRLSELQHLWLTGRLPNGENLVACTRDAGSGTRNGGMNSLGIDPSWARGDNLGHKLNDSTLDLLGPRYQPTNKAGSSRMESTVQNTRLGVGYTGLAGSSRSACDAFSGKYEILNVMFDDRGGTEYVRPAIDTVLDNGDPSTGWQIGGPETFASRGNPFDEDPLSPTYVANQNAAGYVRNIVESINAFVEAPSGATNFFMPGQLLAEDYFLMAGVDHLPDLENPTSFNPNPDLNQELQEYIREHNGLGWNSDTPDYAISPANKVPSRVSDPDWPPFDPDPGSDPGFPPDGQYSDTSTTGAYADLTDPNDPPTFGVIGGILLNERNAISGDFNNDGVRNADDIPGLIAAVQDPRAFAWDEGVVPGDPSEVGSNYVIPEIIGDLNGDGNFDAKDVRYFADGLAIDSTGRLNRKTGFSRVDTAFDGNYFGTTLVTGIAYTAGDSRADVAGDPAQSPPWPGARPHGHDGTVDAFDIDYVYANFGDWTEIDDAVAIDLSCDMNGDLRVNQIDVYEIVRGILCTEMGDANLDGIVNTVDVSIVQGHLNQPGGWADGDFNGNGTVDNDDLAVVQNAIGCVGDMLGDANCDGVLDSFDIDAFVVSLTNPSAWNYPPCDRLCVTDMDRDGTVDAFDIDVFVFWLTNQCD